MTEMQMSQIPNNPSLTLVNCPKNNPAFMVCLGQICLHKAFICKDQNCQCYLPHKSCLKFLLKNLQETILLNSYSLQPLEKDIDKIFNDAIDLLSTERDSVIKEIQEKFHYLGLNKFERKFIDVIKKGTNDEQINGQFVWKLHLGLKGQTKVKQGFDEISKQLKIIKDDFDVQIKNFSCDFTKLLQQVKQREEEIFLKSKIIRTIEDQNKLLAFFTDHQVVGAELLYRASENDFLVSKWHKKCDHIPHTLTIVENEHNKVFGGFTSFSWYKQNTETHSLSSIVNSKNHFLFSLTNNDKFTITQHAEECIWLGDNDDYGPVFGGGNDLFIANRGNENTESQIRIGHTFTNINYSSDDNQSYVKFAGARNFKLKEWEVWRVMIK